MLCYETIVVHWLLLFGVTTLDHPICIYSFKLNALSDATPSCYPGLGPAMKSNLSVA